MSEVEEPPEPPAHVSPEDSSDAGDAEPDAHDAHDAAEEPVAADEVQIVDVEPDEPDDADVTRAEFDRRVEERVQIARYPHSLTRVTHSPRELSRIKELDAQAAVWVPVVTFAVTAVCAMIVVILATQIADDPGHGKTADLVVGVVTLVFLAAGFATLVKSQAYFDKLRPAGRQVRTDLADAYETIRDGAAVFLELGVMPQALSRIADLLPQAEVLLDLIVEAEGRGTPVKGHPAYEQLIRMGAEVTVLTDMAEERLGRRSARRRDRPAAAERGEPAIAGHHLTPFQTLADLAEMIGVEIPPPRGQRESPSDPGLYDFGGRRPPRHD